MKKYKLSRSDSVVVGGRKLHRITALRRFGDVVRGQQGGYVGSEYNLSQRGTCWIYDDAKVSGKARVCNKGKVKGNISIGFPIKIRVPLTIMGTKEALG